MPLKIQDTQLTEKHIGREVVYVPDYLRVQMVIHNRSSYIGVEIGKITSWNDSYVFVDYGTGTSQATRPEDLMWE